MFLFFGSIFASVYEAVSAIYNPLRAESRALGRYDVPPQRGGNARGDVRSHTFVSHTGPYISVAGGPRRCRGCPRARARARAWPRFIFALRRHQFYQFCFPVCTSNFGIGWPVCTSNLGGAGIGSPVFTSNFGAAGG